MEFQMEVLEGDDDDCVCLDVMLQVCVCVARARIGLNSFYTHEDIFFLFNGSFPKPNSYSDCIGYFSLSQLSSYIYVIGGHLPIGSINFSLRLICPC